MGTENEETKTEEPTGIDDAELLAAIEVGIDEATPDLEKPADGDKGDPDKDDPDKDDPDKDDPDKDDPDKDDPDKDDPDKDDPDKDDPDKDDPDKDDPDKDDPDKDDPDKDDPDKDDPDKDDPDKDDPDKNPDPINDPIPETTKKETAERIQALIGIARERSSMAERGEEILTAITATGADPQQYAATLAFVQLYNSDKPEDRAQALVAARGVVRELSLELGDGADQVVKLADHPDLQAEVEAETLTEERAVEIAAQRERDKMRETRTSARKTKDDQAAETKIQIARGQEQLNNLEATLDSADPNYKALRPAFINMLKPVLRRTHPDDWSAAAQDLYTQLKALNPTVKSAAKPAPKNKPLRPKGDAGSSNNKKAEPSSAEEAVDAALDNM